MQTYSQFQPTGFDTKGLSLPDRQDWLVLPVAINRDTEGQDALAWSNFHTVLEDLGDEDNPELEVHRFGHWANGWFEIILVKPDTQTADRAEEWERALDYYPVASDEHYSQVENEWIDEAWEHLDLRGRIEICAGMGAPIMAARHSYPPHEHDDTGDYLRSQLIGY